MKRLVNDYTMINASCQSPKINFELLTRFFESNPDRVFAPADLERLFFQQASEWNLPPSMRSQAFVQMLLNRTKLKEVRLRSHHYASLVRYSWEGKASPMAVAISIKKDGAFFSHASAMWIHGLSEDHTSIFINKEQSLVEEVPPHQAFKEFAERTTASSAQVRNHNA